jgi:hypothetical protein
MSARQRLPNRRASETFALECAGLITATISASDGRVGESSGNQRAAATPTPRRDAAIAYGIALQFGADIETIRKRCAATAAVMLPARSVSRSI